MRMIPSQPLHTNSYAEKQVFDQLRLAFSCPEQKDWFALHSLNLPRHDYKRFGEADFVVCGPHGLFVLEVKGGKVSCHDGIWETSNRYNETVRLRESPFKQAEGALHSIRLRLPESLLCHTVVGYGVIVPDIAKLPEGAEWDREMYADSRDFMQFEAWLRQLVSYWRAKDPHKNLSSSNLQRLQQYLRPDFEAVISLQACAEDVERRIARLTEDQLRFIDTAEANTRVVCSGGAGTGKTMLALELARRWGALGLQTGLICYSPWLKHFLERTAIEGLTVSLLHALPVTARRAGIERFDALIIDEGQDILHLDALTTLDRYLCDGISHGRWCFFHDSNNQSGLSGSYSPEAHAYLEGLSPAKIPLKTNCRNALPIVECIQNELHADLGVAGVGDGPAVREAYVTDAYNAVQLLEKELHYLIDIEGFDYGDVVVLSPLPFGESWICSVSDDWQNAISILDEASPRIMYRQSIGFAQIGDFKGLESKVVILINMPKLTHDIVQSLHYVGMSRARALLSIFYC